MVDSLTLSSHGQPGPCQTLMSRTQAEDVRMEIDLTGDDDIVEQDMSNLSLSAKDSPCLNAETYDSVARALHDTFSRNFTSSLNAFSPSSLFHNSPQLQVGALTNSA